ncbi:hypothetical protein BpHYR1_030983 [Brachionus plicatilis]|uniref:Uncharacterized protein n=1 Tax=Brachionus plicatilis TaxID=10195 RepID=A0A3M7QN64_BRAPC|nr:hypothetical protein BpHYR1_030983 [Brachionus plicatilis]
MEIIFMNEIIKSKKCIHETKILPLVYTVLLRYLEFTIFYVKNVYHIFTHLKLGKVEIFKLMIY